MLIPALSVSFIPLSPEAVLPVRGTAAAVGYDLAVVGDHVLALGETRLLPTGLALAAPLPGNVEIQIRPRSSLFLKTGLIIPNSPGTIDPDYTGEIKVIVHRLADIGSSSSGILNLLHGTRIAQMVFVTVEHPTCAWGQLVERAERGGFGSTGT